MIFICITVFLSICVICATISDCKDKKYENLEKIERIMRDNEYKRWNQYCRNN